MKITMKFALVLLVIFIYNCDILSQSIENPKLSKELIGIRAADKKLRKKWAKMASSGKTENQKFKTLTNKLISADSANTERLKVIISKYGWPTYSLVGKKASVGAWLIAQHSDRDPLFQIKCLPLLKEATNKGEADPVNYAFLYDRVAVFKGDKQLYATQSTTNNGIAKGAFQPIEDETNIQNRRAVMGFDLHVETYAQQYGFKYKVPTKEEAIQRSNAFEKAYNNNVKKAKQAMVSKNYDDAVTYYLEALKSNGSIKIEDYIETARACSLAKHKESKWASFYLIKAIINGHRDGQEFLSDIDFNYIKDVSPRNWSYLKKVIKETSSK